jgi:uncharacterized protein with GYD domain
MSTYISLINYTQDGIAAIKDSPKRLAVVKKLAKKMGGKVKNFYMTIGGYDLVVIYEMPDEMTSAKFLLTVGSTGAVRTKTLTAFSEAEYREIIAALG